jgi:CHAT domain-containing protein
MDTIQRLREGRVRTPSGRVLAEDPAYWAPFVLVGSGS